MTEATIKTMMSSAAVEWTTPPDLYREICLLTVGKESCDIDLACTPENQLAPIGYHACQGVLEAYAMPQQTAEQRLARRRKIIKWQKQSASNVLDSIRHYTEPKTFWLNPPYGYELPIFAKLALDIASVFHGPKCDAEPIGHTVILLVPARIDTNWYCQFVYPCETNFLKGRVKFGGVKDSAPFPTMFCRIHDHEGLNSYNWFQYRKGNLRRIEEQQQPHHVVLRGRA